LDNACRLSRVRALFRSFSAVAAAVRIFLPFLPFVFAAASRAKARIRSAGAVAAIFWISVAFLKVRMPENEM